MNDELKKILSAFFLVSSIIACLTLFGAGTLTAKQRSEYNSYRTEYALLTVKSDADKIALEVDNKHYSLDLSFIRKIGEYKQWLYFTPFSPCLFFVESVYEIFSS